MKLITIISLIIIILCPISIYGWGAFASIYHNPTTKHTVGFLGDEHDTERKNVQQEQKFIDISLPFIRDLVTNKYPDITFLVEANYESLHTLLEEIKQRVYISLSLLDMLILINISPATLRAIAQQAATLPAVFRNITNYEKIYNFILQRMGLNTQQPINFIGNDVRIMAVSQVQQIYFAYIRNVALSTYIKYLTKLGQPYSVTTDMHKKSLQWIDLLFFDPHYEEELVNMGFSLGEIQELKNYFINTLYNFTKQFTIYGTLYTTQSALNEIDFYIQKIDSNANKVGTNQNLWLRLKSKLLSAKKVLENIQNQCPNINNDIYLACLISYAQYIKSFYALTETFRIDLKNAQSEIINFHKALMALMASYADTGFLITILDEEQKNHDIFCFLGSAHCRKLSKALEQLGYQKIYYYDHNPLTEEEVKMLFLIFFNTSYYTKH